MPENVQRSTPNETGKVVRFPTEYHQDAIKGGDVRDMQSVVDQRARDMAQSAISKIQSHEDKCEIRDANKIVILDEIKDKLDGLYDRFWVAALSTIAMLTTACSTLIYMVVSKH